jgi:L,D-transpeptidase YbiS
MNRWLKPGGRYSRPLELLRSGRWRPTGLTARRALAVLAGALVLGEALGLFLAWRGDGSAMAAPTPQAKISAEQLQAANQHLAKKILAQQPAGDYLVVDTAKNLVTLRRGDVILRSMPASCGSGSVLEDAGSGRRWVFDTPRGQHRIQSKVKNPLWIKPDWAFLEAGEPIPAKASMRAEPGAMGDYALGLGNGYFIHGTLYKRMLGRNVSHGCVRLGDEDLAQLYRTLPIGTRVFIF